MQGDRGNRQPRAPGAIARLSLLALASLAWAAVAHLPALFAAPLPDFAAGLTFALILTQGGPGLAAVAAGWLLCQGLGAVPGALAEPLPAVIHIAGFGLFALAARQLDGGGRPARARELLALWGTAAAAAALVATLTALLRTADQPGPAFLRAAGEGWLAGAAGIALALVPFWAAPAAPGAGRWLWALLLSAAVVAAAGPAPWPAGEAALLALLTAAALLGAGAAALGGGLAGVAVQGLLMALASAGLAGYGAPLPWPAWLGMLALAQVAGSVLAVVQEHRQWLAAQHLAVEQDAERQRQLALLQLVADHGADVITVHGANLDLCYASPQLHRLLGLAADERPRAMAALLPRLHPADRPAALPAELPDSGRWRFRIRGGDHRWHWLESLYTAVGEGGERRYIVVTRDIGAHVEQTETLHAMALHDPLTQLYNRRAAGSLGERLWEEALAHRMPFAVVLLDIDHFKRINDTHGHDAGDEVIRQVAAILPEFTRQRDLVCRWGGEEFLMLLPESDAEGACQIAERVRGEVASTVVKVGGRRLQINISAGVAERCEGDMDLGAVIERADQGLYAAKEQGRNRVVQRRAG